MAGHGGRADLQPSTIRLFHDGQLVALVWFGGEIFVFQRIVVVVVQFLTAIWPSGIAPTTIEDGASQRSNVAEFGIAGLQFPAWAGDDGEHGLFPRSSGIVQ